MRIVIVTSIHPIHDKRIFHRQAKLLLNKGFEVHLIAPMHKKYALSEGIHIHGFPLGSGYAGRLLSHKDIFRIACGLDGALYHFHDPDLLWTAVRIKRRLKAPVVYDAHEDVPLALRNSPRFNSFVGGVLGTLADAVERILVRRLDGVVCPHRIRLGELTSSGVAGVFLPNYAPRDVSQRVNVSYPKERVLVYSGVLTRERGAYFLLDAAERMPGVRFLLLAKFMLEHDQCEFERELTRRRLPNLEFRGFVPFDEMFQYLTRASLGIMPWLATEQHLRAAQPSKLYEYMACGLPILASDLPITREVIQESGSGLLHKPNDVEDFVKKARRILDDQDLARQMAESGRNASMTTYNYESASEQLIKLYDDLGVAPTVRELAFS